MGLNIKNEEVERLAADVARLAHETKTEAIRKALKERKARLEAGCTAEDRRKDIRRYLEEVIWPMIPDNVRGKTITKEEEEEMLGIGPEGYSERYSDAS